MFVTMRQVTLYEQLREIDRAWIGVDRAITQRAERALQLSERLDAAPRILRLIGRLDAAATPAERLGSPKKPGPGAGYRRLKAHPPGGR